MTVHLSIHSDTINFLAAAGPMLYARETVNNLILGVSERLASDPAAYQNPFFATARGDDGQYILASVMTPPHNLILAGEAGVELVLPALIDHLNDHKIPVPGVIGPAEIADSFIKAWMQTVGGTVDIGMHQRVYELRQVEMPSPSPGEFRTANPNEIPIIAKWFQGFQREALRETHDLDLEHAKQLVTHGMIFVWDCDGKILAMAMKTRPIAHSITVSGVYTPPEHRRRGYASILVARLSQLLLDEGYQFVNLFTDLDNPTTNKIYQAIGYRPVCNFHMFRFKGTG